MATLFPEIFEPQRPIDFPPALVDKYLPQEIGGFVGLAKAKTVLKNFARSPRPANLLLHGEPGVGKTSMAFALARAIGSSVVYVGAGRLTVDMLDEIRDRVRYYPPTGRFWSVICDEVDKSTEKAQVHWLSFGDQAASLRLVMGGASEPGPKLPVVWIMTTNNLECLEKRFLTRCHVIPFSMYSAAAEIAAYLESIWTKETSGLENPPDRPNFTRLVKDCNSNVRDCLLRMDTMLLGL